MRTEYTGIYERTESFKNWRLILVADLMKEVFVYKHTNITADQFLALVASPKPDSPKHVQAFDHFVQFINHLELEDTCSQGTEFNIGLG